MTSTQTVTATETNTQVKAPPMFRVVYINDNTTSMLFVIESLIDHFSYTDVTAEKIANLVHVDGSAVAAVLPFELAEQKGIEVTVDAREQGFPLQIRIEKEAS